MPLPEYFIQELKSRCDINEVISSYVNLKRRGKNTIGLCPFHNEKTPSFTVYPENGSFFCFGCETGGDVITFIMKIENLDYIEAVKLLAARAGLQMPEDGYDDSMSKLRSRVLEINREAARFYHNYMMSPEGKSGLDYFLGRQMSLKTIKHFGLGYAPKSGYALVNHLRALKFTQDEMIKANVAFQSRRGNLVDRFYDRAMFPIIDLRGNVVAFGGRRMDNDPNKAKYINSSDTPVYHKGSGLFAMNFAKNSGGQQLILAEGYMDVISLHAAGFTNAIASLGTALTTEQARVISRYAKEIIICYDSDSAGQNATQRAIPILRDAGLLVKVLTVPGDKDPDEFMKSNGKDGPAKFKALIEACGNDVEYRLEKLKLNHNLLTAEGKVQYLTAASDTLGTLENPIEREVYAGKLSEELKVDKEAILRQIEKNVKASRNKRRKQETRDQIQVMSGAKDSVNPERRDNMRIANAEEGIIAYLFNNPDGVDYIKDKLQPEKFVTDFNRRVYKYILGKNILGTGLNLTDFSADFTPAELSSLSRILASRSSAPMTRKDADECADILLSETNFSSAEKIKNADKDELMDYLDKLRKQKK